MGMAFPGVETGFRKVGERRGVSRLLNTKTRRVRVKARDELFFPLFMKFGDPPFFFNMGERGTV